MSVSPSDVWAVAVVAVLVWLVPMLAMGFPALTVCRALGLRRRYWAAVPMGGITSLRRAVGFQGFQALWPALVCYGLLACFFVLGSRVPIIGLFASLALVVAERHLWRHLFEATGVHARWAWLMPVPLVNLPVAWHVSRGLPQGEPWHDEGTAPVARKARPQPAAVPVAREPMPAPVVTARPPGADRPLAASASQPLAVRRSGRVPVWVLVLLSNVALVAAFGGFLVADKQALHWYSEGESAPKPQARREPTPAPEPDRVVGVLRLCDVKTTYNLDGVPRDNQTRVDREGGCEAAANARLTTNHRLEVTVRTFSGGSYVVTVPPETRVRVGDTWPP